MSSNTNNSEHAAPTIERTFELAIYDLTINENGKETYRKVAYPEPVTVTATSQAELQGKLALFTQCGQLAKVVRVIAEKPLSTSTPVQTDGAIDSTAVINTKDNDEHENLHDASKNLSLQTTEVNLTVNNIIHNKPRYFKVGDIEVKDDNGKIYQKQWMKLTDVEASNFRIINEKNNSTINLTGKHIEMKRWVLIENTSSEDSVINIEENLK